MALAYSDAINNARLDEIRDAIDGGTGAALLRIYNGTRPSKGGTATTLLAELTMFDPSAPNATGGVLTMNAITADSSANNTGTATWFRVVQSDGSTFVLDGDVSTSGSDLNLNSVSIQSGQTVEVTSWTITAGNA
jgi:hypothetical protein